jgi:hypothetical protein
MNVGTIVDIGQLPDTLPGLSQRGSALSRRALDHVAADPSGQRCRIAVILLSLQHVLWSIDAMAQTLSRQVLYELVWSTPLKQLCERFGISDVALKKTCAKADISTPERGYWARKEAGKNVQQIVLPRRAPGMVGTRGGGSKAQA